jgi:hypothetical protein
MKKVLAVGAVLAVLVVPATAFAAIGGWHVAAQQSARGQFATTATDATVNRPHKIAVYFGHGSGFVSWACSRGFSIGSWSHNFGPGFHTLGHVRGQGSCDVTASVGGSGRVTVQILTHR